MFFSLSLLIEIVFSLDGLGFLGYESIVSRDYFVVFGLFYIFMFLGLVVSLISDLFCVVIDFRIDFEKC